MKNLERLIIGILAMKTKRLNLIGVVLMIFFMVAGCGGGGGDGGVPSIEPPPAPLIVSGTVQAPNGQIAFSPKQDFLERFISVLATSANALVSGISTVADGTPVELVRMNVAREPNVILPTITIALLATTTTSAGKYSFDLTALGLSLSNDLVVQVANPSTGAKMRAFITGEKIDINPVSEAAVRIILDRINITEGATLGNFTLQELNDITASVDLLTTVRQTASGIDLKGTVAAIESEVRGDAGFFAFLVSASGPGQTVEGSGDIGNFFPFTQGNIWRSRITQPESGGPPVEFFNTTTITGTKVVNGVMTTIFREDNPDNTGTDEEGYFLKDSRGITEHGNSDVTDLITPQIAPIQWVRFPLQAGSIFEAINRFGVDFGEDLDGDGVNEKADLNIHVMVIGFEEVTVPAGTFPNSVKIETKGSITVTRSHDGSKVTITGTTTEWFAPGVGFVKSLDESEIVGQPETKEVETEDLVGFVVDGKGMGIRIELSPSAAEITVGDAVQLTATAFDAHDSPISGLQFTWTSSSTEIATVNVIGLTTGVSSGIATVTASIGDITSNPSKLTVKFIIASGITVANSNTENPGKSALGFDGNNYLLVSCREIGVPSGIFGVTISSKGEILKTFHVAEHDCQFPKPSIAFDGSNYLIVFQRNGQIFGTRTTASGTVLDGPTGFAISSGIPFSVTNWSPAVAFGGANYLVVWNKFIDGTHEIFGSRVTPGGQVLDEIPIFRALGEQVDASVAFAGTNYLVVWRDTRSGSGPNSETNIFGARVTTTGAVLDPMGIPVSTAPGMQGEPKIIFDGNNYFVVWLDGRNDPTATQPRLDVFGARIRPDGALLDGSPDTGGITINTSSFFKFGHGHPDVDFDGTHYFVLWEAGGFPSNPPVGIFGTRISADGVLIDGPADAKGMAISATACFACRLVYPKVISNGENFLLTWINNIEQSGTTKDIVGLVFP